MFLIYSLKQARLDLQTICLFINSKISIIIFVPSLTDNLNVTFVTVQPNV